MIKWRKDWEHTNLDRNRAPPLAAFTVLDELCNWITPGDSPEQTMNNKRKNKRSNQNNNLNESAKKSMKKPWIRGPACWSRYSCRRRVWTSSRGLDAASTVVSMETV